MTARAGHRRAVDARLGARGARPRHRARPALIQDRATRSWRRRAGAARSWPCSSTRPAAPIQLPAHTLPSARGQGEPLSGRLNPPEGASFAAVLIGEPADKWLLACDAGHGFIARARVAHRPQPRRQDRLPPAGEREGPAGVAGARGRGRAGRRRQHRRRLLAFPVADLPGDGKGPRQPDLRHTRARRPAPARSSWSRRSSSRRTRSLVVHCGERKMTLSWKDLQDYRGERGQRGAVLPRGWRKVDRLNVE